MYGLDAGLKLGCSNAQAVVGIDRDVGRLLQLGQVGHGHFVDHVHVAGQQRGVRAAALLM